MVERTKLLAPSHPRTKSASTSRRGVAGVVAVGDADAAVDLLDAGHLGVAPQFDTPLPQELVAQHGLERGLVEHVRLRVAVRAGRGVAAELGQHAVVLVAQLQSVRRP